jgi:HTH-type transcriptional regulator / antitoxin MqsA
MKCLSCGMAELVQDTRDFPYTYKGECTTIPMVRGDFCPACGESVLGAIKSARVSGLMLEFNKQVNASIIDPAFITKVRKKLGLDQQEASTLFGGGVNAFSRYETGKTKPPLSLVRLFQLLDLRPELLSEIQTLPLPH